MNTDADTHRKEHPSGEFEGTSQGHVRKKASGTIQPTSLLSHIN